MKKKPDIFLKIAVLMLILLAIANTVLSVISLNAPVESSEFAAMHNFAMGLYSLLIIVICLIMLATGFFVYKLKRWAYILNLILLIFLIPLSEISNIKGIEFILSLGSTISLTKEIIPIIILILLILSIKNFKKIK